MACWCLLYTDYSHAIDTIKFSKQCSGDEGGQQMEGCLKSKQPNELDEDAPENFVEVPISQCRYANHSMVTEKECAFAIKCEVEELDQDQFSTEGVFAPNRIFFTIYGACTTRNTFCPSTALGCLKNVIYQAVYYQSGYTSYVVDMEFVRSNNHVTYATH